MSVQVSQKIFTTILMVHPPNYWAYSDRDEKLKNMIPERFSLKMRDLDKNVESNFDRLFEQAMKDIISSQELDRKCQRMKEIVEVICTLVDEMGSIAGI